MKSNNTLDILCERAKEELDQAAIRLGQVRKSHQTAKKQLEQLQAYEKEYRQKLQSGMAKGMASASWYNYQQFIITLETAIEQHRILLTQWNQHLQQAISQWQDKQQRLNALDTLLKRNSLARQVYENRQDQKRMDEFAQQTLLRKT
ncbi:flagellar export protein FliJ [Sodalis ligni]|jgi:flagellar FliJ protein|uniref:Flagellar FliJ protein n=1 Tax=Sodalis ligni TaxID=2697027 RepID=A0A4R1N5E3_9GAMM|nr:flagellar export protein FliJ [Sodalis ligni]TCL02272.1 flagellar FliJ protein [Sodalis ligni]